MALVHRQLTSEQVWIAKLFRAACAEGRVSRRTEGMVHLPGLFHRRDKVSASRGCTTTRDRTVGATSR